MSRFYSIICLASLLTTAAIDCRAKEWRGIAPLYSTRSDVERLPGPYGDEGQSRFESETEYERIEAAPEPSFPGAEALLEAGQIRERDRRSDERASGRPPTRRRKGVNSKAPGRGRYPKAPDIIIIGLDGKNILLDEKLGKVLVIDFWATWCPPCRRMVPIFNSLQEKYRNQGLEVIGISMDAGTTADLKGLSDEFGLRYTGADGDSETEEAFGIVALPTTLLIDRNGRIRARHKGLISQAKLDSEIKKLLAE